MHLVSTERKTALLAQFARVGKALGNPARLQLLDLLIQAERSVEALAAAAGMPVGNTSAQLRAAGAVTSSCRAPTGARAPDAPGRPRPRGRAARHLAEGMLEWRLDGLPVEAA